jgi:CRP-like cAMP-binding protein
MSTLPAPHRNQLLAALTPQERSRLLPYLELTPMTLGQVLHEYDAPITCVYFPVDSIVSLICVMGDGASAEISVVGHEGVAGIGLCMGNEIATSRAVVQSAGYAYRLDGELFNDEFRRHGRLHDRVLRYTQALLAQIAQTAVCNRHHTVDQQLCRWVLLSLDRLPGNRLTMTQQLIANMLGVRREGVTEAAGKLQRLGIIRYSRGRISVIDRDRLEEMCCECYAVIRREFDRLVAQPLKESA